MAKHVACGPRPQERNAMTVMTCRGFSACGVSAGLKKNGTLDLGLLVSDRPAAVAAVFTQNRVQAAPVTLDRERVRCGVAQAVIVNSGNANCATGKPGAAAARSMTAAVAAALKISENHVLAASTGVIGVPFPIHKVTSAIPQLVERLDAGGIPHLAHAIMTTDTRPKMGLREGPGAVPYRIVAVAKGAGMIRPDMATMLCFVVTDAQIAADPLQAALQGAVDASFNRITIDGDTSTNDTVVLMANGASGAAIATSAQRALFGQLLTDLLKDLARQMVRDGEGVTKVVDLTVCGARSDADAHTIADVISHSPLVKTAFFGEDANWGRIVAAAGRAGAFLDPDRLSLHFDDVQMVAGGTGCGEDAERRATAVLKQPEFSVVLDLHVGDGSASMLTCDFSLDYVKINADYRS